MQPEKDSTNNEHQNDLKEQNRSGILINEEKKEEQ